MIAVPNDKKGLNLAIAEAHKRYSRRINFREGWQGRLWQGRFASFMMDETYLFAYVRYVLLNPVRAKLIDVPEAWKWSSAKSHLGGKDDIFVKTKPLSKLLGDSLGAFLALDADEIEMETFRKHERTGKAAG